MARGHALGVDALIDSLWEDAPPGRPRGALQAIVSRARRALPAGAIGSTEHGYRLEGVVTDLEEAEAAGDDAGPLLLRSALALWRGDPGDGLPAGTAERLRTRADPVRRRLRRALAAALSAEPEHADEAAELWRRLWDESPYDDAAVAGYLRALNAAGRPAEALDAFGRHRRRLRDDLGADPGAAVTELNAELLRGTSAVGGRPRRLGLRAGATELVGREVDLAALRRTLHTARLVTLLGAGGLGKTRLAQEAAAGVAAAAQGTDVVVVELAPLETPADVLPALAALLGVGGVRPGKTLTTQARVDVRGEVIAALTERPALLVLDNCEHLIGEAARLATDLLAQRPRLTILTTSRAPLSVPQEEIHALPPLPVDVGGAAVRLFTTRARAARPGALLPVDLVHDVCARLDGSPLAIELAAARVRGMGLQELHDRLDDRFALLRGGDRTAPPRHRSLLAVIEWSWDLLAPGAKDLLPRLALFPDGFTVEAAEAVAAPSRRDDALADLAELVEQSLVQLMERPGQPVRYRLLETVREFGTARLRLHAVPDAAEPGPASDAGSGREPDEATVRAAMIAWGVAFARVHRPLQAVGERQVELFSATGREVDNLVAVLRWAIAWEDAPAATAVFACLGTYWTMRAAAEEIGALVSEVGPVLALGAEPSEPVARDLLSTALILASLWGMVADRRAGARARAALRRLSVRVPSNDPLVRAHESLALLVPHPARVTDELQRLGDSPDPRVAVLALCLRIPLLENDGHLTEALGHGERLRSLERRTGPVWPGGLVGVFLTQILQEMGRPQEALEMAAASLEAMETYGGFEAPGEPGVLDWTVALACAQVGEVERARETAEHLPRLPGGPRPAADGNPPDRPARAGARRRDSGVDPEREPAVTHALGLVIEAELADRADDPDRAYALSAEACTRIAEAEPRPRDPRLWATLALLVSEHLLRAAGRGEADRTAAHRLRMTALAAQRLRGQGPDLPVLGLAVLALAAWGGASGELDDEAIVQGWALGLTLGARQDFTPARHGAVRSLLTNWVGAEVLDEARSARIHDDPATLRRAARAWLEAARA